MSKRFKTQDHSHYKKLGIRWRKARGRQSKMRVKKGGSGLKPAIGYGTAAEKRYKVSGLMPVLVSNLDDMKGIGKECGIILSSSLGMKKTGPIEKKANEMGIRILNRRRLKKLRQREEQIKKKSAGKETPKKEAPEAKKESAG